MKQNFLTMKEKLDQFGILRISTDFYLAPKRRGVNFFVKSPVSNDKHWSLCLYPSTNTYCDFAGGSKGGDIISFISYIKGINNWEALKELQAFYGLKDASGQDRQEVKRRIRLQQEKERKRKERKLGFRTALFDEIDRLKRWDEVYTVAIEKRLFEPYTDLWAFCLNEKQITEHKLDILTGSECAYRRLKPYHENISSDRFQWLLDVLDILQKQGEFQATETELSELKAQADFELTRKLGWETRRCGVEW